MNARQYRVSDDPRALLDKLYDFYGRMTLQEKTNMELAWSAPWTPAEPIEVLIDCLEDCFVLAKPKKIAHTFAQMVDKALTAIQVTGLFPTAILE